MVVTRWPLSKNKHLKKKRRTKNEKAVKKVVEPSGDKATVATSKILWKKKLVEKSETVKIPLLHHDQCSIHWLEWGQPAIAGFTRLLLLYLTGYNASQIANQLWMHGILFVATITLCILNKKCFFHLLSSLSPNTFYYLSL